MSNYTPSTDFAAKDSLLSGNPNKIVKGTEITAELTSIAAAVATKADSSSSNAFQAGATTLGATTATSLNSTPIGNSAPSTGAFTTLSASSGINATAIGNTSASTGAFTTLSSTATGTFKSAGGSYSNGNLVLTDSTGAYNIGITNINNTLWIGSGSTDRLGIDASGNLGLGVTPSAWGTGYKAINIATGGAIYANTNTSASINIGTNVKGANIFDLQYQITGQGAAQYNQYNGVHSWSTAPSGTAGNAISFGDPDMTLDASGNFLVGTTSLFGTNNNGFVYQPASGYGWFHHSTSMSSGQGYAVFTYNGGTIGSITQSGTTAVVYNTTSDHRLKENVRPADAARFMDIEFVDFEWTDGRHDCGVIAHQLASVYPDLVLGEKDATEVRTVEITPAVPEVKDEDGNVITPAIPAVTEEQTFPVYQQVNYIGLIGRMGTRIQSLQRTVDAQAAMLAAMEARLAALEAA